MPREINLIGEDLGEYRIIAELNVYAQGYIFLGESLASAIPGEQVVIKLIHTTQVQKQELILQEIAALQQLRHPHILPILSFGVHDGMLYIVTPHISSDSLHDYLQRTYAGKPMPQEEALFLVDQIGQALLYAHQQHVIH